MRLQSIALALAMLVCMAGAAAAQPLVVSEAKVDFGSMTEGPVASKTVTLTNAGKEVLVISNVTTS
ncbi:DUF1573 domain-containing protein [Pseudodesulfovibrio thermohalotolerans]|nr:DUF1573 domain-containing protein [Pseudodesulfovibrio thermohalotolerans]WFS61800.1 DUF1573 domain-containing protein [Pseudodesulfovibrio thermohalotolerans]